MSEEVQIVKNTTSQMAPSLHHVLSGEEISFSSESGAARSGGG